MSDQYRIVTVLLRGVRENSIFVAKLTDPNLHISVPRSLLHGADDLKMPRSKIDTEITFRLRDWKAEELGL
jgi:hypothetical protein